MRSVLALVTITAAACAHTHADVKGSGRSASEARAVGAFTAIESRGAYTVDVTTGPTTAVTISGDDNVVPLIRTERKGDTLVIDNRDGVSPRLPIVVQITTPALSRFDLDGSGRVTIDGVHGAPLAIELAGSGPIAVRGDTPVVTATISGSGQIDAHALTAAAATVTISGSGSVDVTATDSLTADISGSGSVHFAGNPPHVVRHVTGSGSVEPR